MAKITHEEKMRTKKRIEEAAREVFAEKGVIKASVREVAKRAGVGASTIYGYYPSKPLLFMNSILPSIETRQEMSTRLESLDVKNASVDEIVDVITDATFVLPQAIHQFDRKRIREIHMILFNEANDIDEIRTHMERFMEREIMVILIDFFDRLQDAGRFIVDVKSHEMAELIIGIMRLIFLEYVIILDYSEELCFSRHRQSIRLILMGKI